MSITRKIQNLAYDIMADIDHGECFYDGEMLLEFINNLDKMKELAYRYYDENKDELE